MTIPVTWPHECMKGQNFRRLAPSSDLTSGVHNEQSHETGWLGSDPDVLLSSTGVKS